MDTFRVDVGADVDPGARRRISGGVFEHMRQRTRRQAWIDMHERVGLDVDRQFMCAQPVESFGPFEPFGTFRLRQPRPNRNIPNVTNDPNDPNDPNE